MGKRRLIGKIVILMLGLAAVVILAANSDTIPVSTPKKGYRVVIDPGHGGSDCGAVGVSGVKEAETARLCRRYYEAVARLLRQGFPQMREEQTAVCSLLSQIPEEELEALGMEAILTRSDERALAEGKKADMAARGKIMNGEGVDLVVSVHMNKFTDPSVHGPMAFYMKGSAEGEKLAKTVIDSITDELGAPRRIANPGDYYVIRESMPVSVLVECGFLSNSGDEALLQQEQHQKKLAHAIARGIFSYFEGDLGRKPLD